MLQNGQMLSFERHDWETAKEFYISAGWLSGVTLETVADRFNIPYQSVRRRAAKEKWRLIRKWKSQDPDCVSLEEYMYYYEN